MYVCDRRQLLGALAGLSAAALGASCAADEKDKKDSPSPNLLAGAWTYRSLASDPNIATAFDKLEFWRATLTIAEPAALGVFEGRLDGSPTEELALTGAIVYGGTITARFVGRGDKADSMDWVYDYLAFLIPSWPNGVRQRPALVGTVVRSKPHKSDGGVAPAGVVAQWIAVKRDG